uniref:Mitochondrial ribosomal protein S9 n=1 Tax=Leptobrachium leishanense TaxID=445787 RepID=A0A8C5MUA1_9ANUR
MASLCRSPGLGVVLRAAGVSGWSPAVRVCGKAPPLIHTSAAVQRKHGEAPGREKYTDAFIKKQIEEFNIGKRHLANMMGEDPETFTQEDIDKAIAYLFPSGLFEKRARPTMKHPEELFPKCRVSQWGEDGRPFHFLFYTGKQSYYALMHELYGKLLSVQQHEEQMRKNGLYSENTKQIELTGSRWMIKEELEDLLVETMSDQDYLRLIQMLECIQSKRYSGIEGDYLLKFCKKLEVQSKKQVVNPLQYDENGVAFSTGEGRRKTSSASVVLRDCGKGLITVNGIDYLEYFSVLQDNALEENPSFAELNAHIFNPCKMKCAIITSCWVSNFKAGLNLYLQESRAQVSLQSAQHNYVFLSPIAISLEA